MADLLATQNIAKLARHIGVTAKTLHNWINEGSVPHAALILPLAEALRVDVAELVQVIAATAKRIAARKAA